MPSGSYRQADVQCPFYKYDDGRRRITCEGIIDKSSIALIYLTRKDFDIQLLTFCCEHYKRCEVYTMLAAKYDDD
ncbi:MAG: hypothetical protein J6Q92_00080 [Oscillospiraceae bacterium]|nr:hypothetical protein [Oscillospiraceae bacterium]